MTVTYKNIVIYSQNLPPESVGGIETNALYLIKNLMRMKGVQLHVVTLTKRRLVFFRSKKIRIESENITVHLLKKTDTRKPGFFLGLLRRLQCATDNTVIYHNTLDLHRLYGAIKDSGYRQVARSGGNDIFFLKPDVASKKTALENFRHLDRIFLNSQYSYTRALGMGLDQTSLCVIKGGCARDRELAAAELPDVPYVRPVIISCCRLVDFKGLDDAIQAFHLLDAQGLDFTYLLIGDGNSRRDIEARIAQYGLQRKCVLLGKMPPEQVHDYYRVADIYLSSSKDIAKAKNGVKYIHTETMGRSLCEAQAYGLPVVSTDAGGSSEMVDDGVSGFIVQQGNPDAIAAALTILILDEAQRKAMGRSAEAHARENLSWDAVFTRTFGEIEKLF